MQKDDQKFWKLILDARLFLESLQAAAEKNANTVNATIENLTTSLQVEKEDFENICTRIQADNTEL